MLNLFLIAAKIYIEMKYLKMILKRQDLHIIYYNLLIALYKPKVAVRSALNIILLYAVRIIIIAVKASFSLQFGAEQRKV